MNFMILDWRNNFLSQSLGQVAEAQNKQKLMDIQRFLDTSGERVFACL
jgi:hypothetical protein